MKKIILNIFLFTAFTLAQAQIPIDLNIKITSTQNHVRLRWFPKNKKTYDEIIHNGISVTRIFEGNEQVLLENVYPLTASELRNSTAFGTDANITYQLLYGNTPINFSSNAFENAVKIQNSEQNRFQFFMNVMDRNFGLAKAMALGMVDKESYHGVVNYKISIDNHVFYTSINVDREAIVPPLPPPFLLSTEGEHKQIKLAYNQSELNQNVIGYLFEKTTDTLNNAFTPLNTIPYTFTNATSPELGYFFDSLADNSTVYYYRARQVDVYGQVSDYSNIISGKGRQPRLNLIANLEVRSITESSVSFKFKAVEGHYRTRVTSIQILKSQDVNGSYTTVNAIPIKTTDTTFIDQNLVGSFYYLIEYEDENKHLYRSLPILVQAKDHTPPAVPTILSAVADKQGGVVIKWTDNTEYDFAGYRLYRCNTIDGTYIDVTGRDITDNAYTDYLDTDVIIDSVYYKMMAADLRGNYSAYSNIAAVKRVDLIPPSQPVLSAVFPAPEGNYLTWAPSATRDVAYHVLERASATEGWSAVLTFTPKDQQYYGSTTHPSFTYSYLDDRNVGVQLYSYRLIAYDDSGNYRSSDIIHVTGVTSPIEGRIVYIDEYHTCDQTLTSEAQSKVSGISQSISAINASPNATNVKNNLVILLQNGFISVGQYMTMTGQAASNVAQDLVGISNGIIANDKKKCYINLKWRYSHQQILPDTKFEIYRAINNYTYDLYKTIHVHELQNQPDTNYVWTDNQVAHGRKYSYKIVARNTNNTSSKVSPSVTVVLQ